MKQLNNLYPSSGKYWRLIAGFAIVNLLFLFFPFVSEAATYYSRVASFNFAGGGNNWSTSSSGGTLVAYPGTSHDYVIQNGHTVTLAANQTVAGIRIDAGGTLISGAGIIFTVNGPWVDNGTFTPSTGTVTFATASAAVNAGTGAANFNNVSVASGATLTINNNVTVAGTFTYAATAASIVVTISGTNSLTVSGAWSMPRPSAGFSSTIAVGAGTLSVSGTFTMSATTATRNNVMTISTGTVNLGALTTGTTGCLFTFTGSGTLNISGTVTGGPPALTESTGTINFTGAGAQSIWTETYYNLGFSGAGTKTIATGSTIVVTSNWNVNSPTTMTTTAGANVTGDITGTGAITMGSGTIQLEGDWTNNGTFTRGTGTVNYDGAGAQSIAALSYNNLQVTVGGTKTLAGNTTVNNVLTVSTPATLNLSTFTVTLPLTGTPLVNTGTLSGTGKVLFSGSGAQTVAGTTYYDLEFSGAGTKTILTTTTITVTNDWIVGSPTTMATTAGANVTGSISGSGAITMGSGTIQLEGDWTNNGTFTRGTGTVNYDGAGAQSIAALSYNNLQVTVGGTKTLAGNTTVNNVLTVTTPATLDLSTFTMTLPLTGTPLVNTGTITGTGTVNFSGTGAQTVAGTTYPNLEFSGAGTKTISAGTTITVTSDWVVGSTTTMTTTAIADVGGDISGSGAITMGSGTINIGGNWTNNGTFTRGTGTVIYDGTTQTIGGVTYYNLQTSNTGIKTLGGTTTVANILTIGASTTLDLSSVTLTLSAAGTPLVNNGTFTCSTSTVSFSNASSTNIPALNYYNLTLTGGPRVLAASGTIGIANVFTPGAGAFTVTGSTVDFNGAGAQTIPAFTFNDLVLSGSGAKTILTATTVTVNQININDTSELDLPGTSAINITKP